MSIAKHNRIYHLLLFLISPILALVYGIKTKNPKYIRWSLFVFVVIYGSTMHPSHLGDGAAHFDELVRQSLSKSFSTFWGEMISLLMLSPKPSTATEPYIHILRYVLGTLLDAPRLLFVVVSIIFGYFYSGSIVKLFSYVNWNSNYNKYYFLFFLVLTLLIQTPGDMQSVRQGTAIWVLVYCLISYHQSRKIKYLFLLLLAPFIHLSYFILSIPFLVVLFSNYRNPKVYFIIFMVSVLAANIVNKTAVNDLASQSEVGAGKVQGYTIDEDRADEYEGDREEKRTKNNIRFYRIYESDGIHYIAFTGLIIFMFLFLRNRGFGEIENTLFSYGLAGASFANFLSFNFAVYNRVWLIAGVFILSLLLIFLSKQDLRNISLSFLKVRLPLFLFCLVLTPYILFLLSANLQFTSVYMLFLPVIIWIDFDMGISIRGLIGFFM